MGRIKITLVDDHQLVRDGIKSLLHDSQDIDIIAEAEDCYQLFSSLKIAQPDIIILDISLPKMSGIDVCKQIVKEFPTIKVIMLSMHTGEDFILNAIKAGAKGYLPKNITQKELITSINKVNSGEEYFSKEISDVILKSYVRKAKHGVDSDSEKEVKLTKRETEVLKLVAEGKINTEIAQELFISVRTVESHRNHILKKLDLTSTVDLVKYAIKTELIDI